MPGKRVGSIADRQIEASIHTYRTGKDLIMAGKRIVCVVVIAAACFAVGSAAQEEGKPAVNPADEAIRETARTFVAAFNKGDAKAVAVLWAAEGQLVIDEETTIDGREAIEAEYAAFFRDNPKVKISVTVDSIRFLGPNIAIEKGTSEIEGKKDSDVGVIDAYTLTHLRENGRWQIAIASVVQTVPGTDWQEELAFLIGDWRTSKDDWRVETTCEWIANKNFIRRRFSVYQGKNVQSSGVQVIGWDPQAGQITSWTFGSNGGFGRSYWNREGNNWFISSNGTTRDGEEMAATNVLTVLSDDEFRWQSVDRTLEDYQLEDTDPVRVQRVKSKK
jgi:uncharacterized protein (TIGR02246 family)